MPRARRGALVVVALLAGLLGLGHLASGSAASPSPSDATELAMPADAVTESPSQLGPPSDQAPPATVAAAAAPFVLPTSSEQWFSPSGRNQGTEGVARFLAAVALYENVPLYLSDTWGRTTGSDKSDHHVSRTDSWACDVAVLGIQVPTPATELAAKRVAAALGEPNWAGGDLTRTVRGYRIQLLWKVAGHFNHVHIGVRKV